MGEDGVSEGPDIVLDSDADSARLAFLAAGIPPLDSLTPAAARTLIADLRSRVAVAVRPIAEVCELTCPGRGGSLAMRLYRPRRDDDGMPCLIFFHGGGWALNDLDTHDALCRAICDRADIAVLSVDYRLAPEHPFPAAVEDAVTSIAFAHDQASAIGIDPTRLAVGGDSSGGNLAAVLALMARDGAIAPIRAQALIYPALDLVQTQASYRIAMPGLAVTGTTMHWFRRLYLPEGTDAADWHISPLRVASVAGVAPSLMITAGADPLRDEGLAYAARLSAEGNRMIHHHYPGQMHGFMSASVAAPTAERALDALTMFLRAELAS